MVYGLENVIVLSLDLFWIKIDSDSKDPVWGLAIERNFYLAIVKKITYSTWSDFLFTIWIICETLKL